MATILFTNARIVDDAAAEPGAPTGVAVVHGSTRPLSGA